MRRSIGARRALVEIAGLSLGLGVALALLLVGDRAGASGIVGGEYWILVLIAASVIVGWFAAQLMTPPLLPWAVAAGVSLVVGVIVAVKWLRYPTAPLVGDGFPILAASYVIAGLVAATLGRLRMFRAPSPRGALRAGALLGVLVIALCVFPYVLAMVSGS
jgi:hypothetical protein